jgi:hypothetical protein
MKKSLQFFPGLLIVLAIIAIIQNKASAQLNVTADFDNSHLRANFSVDSKTNTIDYGKCDMNKDTWYYYKLTGCKGKTITFLHDSSTHVSPVEYRLVSYKPITTVNANSYEMIPVTGKTYTHTFKKNKAWIAWHYVASNDMLDNYIKSISKNPFVSIKVSETLLFLIRLFP